MKFSMLPFLFLAQIVAIYLAVNTTRTSGAINAPQSRSIMAVLALLILWGAISTFLGLTGWYLSEAFLTSLPGFWITMPAVLIIMVPWIFSATFRETTNTIIDHVPLHYVMAFEGLRVLAIGGIVKAYNGEFSLFFARWIGGPDFLFGVAALLAAWLIFTGVWEKRSAIVINLFGFIIIVPFGLVLINLGLPGIMHMVDESPSMISIFDFPMALAPTLVVPIFVTINLLVAIRLMTRQH